MGVWRFPDHMKVRAADAARGGVRRLAQSPQSERR
jgi:hypothetical protein